MAFASCTAGRRLPPAAVAEGPEEVNPDPDILTSGDRCSSTKDGIAHRAIWWQKGRLDRTKFTLWSELRRLPDEERW